LSKQSFATGLICRDSVSRPGEKRTTTITAYSADEFNVEYRAQKERGGISKTVYSAANLLSDWDQRYDALYAEDVLYRLNPVEEGSLSQESRKLLHGTLPGETTIVPNGYDHFDTAGDFDRTVIRPRQVTTMSTQPGLIRPNSTEAGPGSFVRDGKPADLLNARFEWRDLVLHNARLDLNVSMFYSEGFHQDRRFFRGEQELRDVLAPIRNDAAKQLFSYALPQIVGLNQEDILQIREKTKDHREGLNHYVNSLISDAALELAGGAKINDVMLKSSLTITTKVLPELHEFHHKLASERLTFGKRLLDSLGRVLQIDAAPWTPKFFGSLIQAFLPNLGPTDEERLERTANKYQAMQFLSKLTAHKGTMFENS
jgi:hypothetical protein